MTRGPAGARTGTVRAVGAACACAAILLAGACSSGPAVGTPPIPTFPGPGAAPATSAPPPRDSMLPTDCNQVVSSDAMPNLLGLPLGSIKVTTVRGVPAPSVGRLERVSCDYTSNGGPGAPPPGAEVVELQASGYTTPEAAQEQARVNAEVLIGQGVAGVPVPFGAAQATFFDDPDGPLLVVVYGRVVTSATSSPGGPVSREQARPLLTDLVQRAMPVIVPSTAGP